MSRVENSIGKAHFKEIIFDFLMNANLIKTNKILNNKQNEREREKKRESKLYIHLRFIEMERP